MFEISIANTCTKHCTSNAANWSTYRKSNCSKACGSAGGGKYLCQTSSRNLINFRNRQNFHF